MVSQTCGQCGSTVAADEQFCPNCGNFIDPMAPQRPPATGDVISVRSDGSYEEFSLDQPPPDVHAADEAYEHDSDAPQRTGSGTTCPSCGAANPPGNRHCQECGARLDQSPLPTAPRPAVQATAGVRAAVAISGLLFVVIIVALLFNVFSDEPVAGDTTLAESTTTTPPAIIEPDVIEILAPECEPEGLSSFTCQNLVSGTDAEYQVNWEELQLNEEKIVIKLLFRVPMIVTRIDWRNIEDVTRFKTNFRARGLTIDSPGSLTPIVHELEDTPGTQTINYAAVDANSVEITIQSAYLAETVDSNVFRELAIDEIVVWGRPANLSG